VQLRRVSYLKVLITGGAGFLGVRLARTLLTGGDILGQSFDLILLADLVPPPGDLIQHPRVRSKVGLLKDQCSELSNENFDLIFHLASAVSAECEADFDLGMRSNLDTIRSLLEALREAGNRPRFVFASSVAVFGSDDGLPLPPVVRDDTLPTPQSSYGTQKFICEQLVTEYTRRGFLDGRSARLMTVTVRPGRPNGAASGFLSAIIREPLAGLETTCPVPAEMAVAVASPARAIEGLIAVAGAGRANLGGRTAINLPALTVTVGEMLDALERVAGSAVRQKVSFETNDAIVRIVGGWPSAFDNARASRLGLEHDPDFSSIIRQYLADQSVSA
jgi:nucleoside-diphosphate-sugar epimerase